MRGALPMTRARFARIGVEKGGQLLCHGTGQLVTSVIVTRGS